MERQMLAHKMPSSRFFQRPSSTFRSAVIDLRIFILLVPGRITPFSLKLTTFALSSCALVHHQPSYALTFPLSTGINHLTHHDPSHNPPLQRLGTTIAHRANVFLHASSLLVSNVREPLHKLAPFPMPAHHHVVPDEHLHTRTWPGADADRGDTKAHGDILREAMRDCLEYDG